MPCPLKQSFPEKNAVNPTSGAQARSVLRPTAEPVSTTVRSQSRPLGALGADFLIAQSAVRLATEARRQPTVLPLPETALPKIQSCVVPENEIRAPYPRSRWKPAVDLVPNMVEKWEKKGSEFCLAEWARGHAVPAASFGPYFKWGKPTPREFAIREGRTPASMTDENLQALAREVLVRGIGFKFYPWCQERGMYFGSAYFTKGELTDLSLQRLKSLGFEWPPTPLGNKYRRRTEQLADTVRTANRPSGPRDGSSKSSLKRAAPAGSSTEAAKRRHLNPGVAVAHRTGGEPVKSGVALWRPPGLSPVQFHRPWECRYFHRPWESERVVEYPATSVRGASSVVPVTARTSAPNERTPPALRACGADMSMANTSAGWGRAHVSQSGSPIRTTSQLEPQMVARQGAEASTDAHRVPRCWRENAQILRSVMSIHGWARQRRDNPLASVETWRIESGVDQGELESLWREGAPTPKGRVLLARSNMGDDGWLERGKALLVLIAAVDQGKPLSVREWGRRYRIPVGSLHYYATGGKVTDFARAWGEEVQELTRIQGAPTFGEGLPLGAQTSAGVQRNRRQAARL